MRGGFPYEHSETLAMCVRLRHAKKITPELDDLLGAVLMDIAILGARKEFMRSSCVKKREMCNDIDVQMDAVLRMLKVIDEGRVDTSKPRSVVNLFVMIAQNTIRNANSISANRQRLRPTVLASQVETMDVSTLNVSDVYGQLTQQPTRRTQCPH